MKYKFHTRCLPTWELFIKLYKVNKQNILLEIYEKFVVISKFSFLVHLSEQ